MSTGRLTILIVEDDRAVGSVLQFIFERQGFAVTLLNDGMAAAEFIGSGAARPALLLLDVMVPYADGYETLRRARARPGWECVPVVMLSARSTEDDVIRAFECGADDYIAKPFRPRELVARVKRLIKVPH